MSIVIACQPECGRWQVAATNERPNLSRLLYSYYYYAFRPEWRYSMWVINEYSVTVQAINTKYITNYLLPAPKLSLSCSATNQDVSLWCWNWVFLTRARGGVPNVESQCTGVLNCEGQNWGGFTACGRILSSYVSESSSAWICPLLSLNLFVANANLIVAETIS